MACTSDNIIATNGLMGKSQIFHETSTASPTLSVSSHPPASDIITNTKRDENCVMNCTAQLPSSYYPYESPYDVNENIVLVKSFDSHEESGINRLKLGDVEYFYLDEEKESARRERLRERRRQTLDKYERRKQECQQILQLRALHPEVRRRDKERRKINNRALAFMVEFDRVLDGHVGITEFEEAFKTELAVDKNIRLQLDELKKEEEEFEKEQVKEYFCMLPESLCSFFGMGWSIFKS